MSTSPDLGRSDAAASGPSLPSSSTADAHPVQHAGPVPQQITAAAASHSALLNAGTSAALVPRPPVPPGRGAQPWAFASKAHFDASHLSKHLEHAHFMDMMHHMRTTTTPPCRGPFDDIADKTTTSLGSATLRRLRLLGEDGILAAFSFSVLFFDHFAHRPRGWFKARTFERSEIKRRKRKTEALLKKKRAEDRRKGRAHGLYSIQEGEEE